MRNKKLLRSMVCGMLCAVMILTGVGVTERTDAASRYVCNQCGKSLSSAHESHTRECGGQLVASKYYCSSCGQTLSDPGSHEHEELVDGITCSSCGGTGKQEIPIDCTTCNGTAAVDLSSKLSIFIPASSKDKKVIEKSLLHKSE